MGSAFRPMEHPRGRPGNSGQFTERPVAGVPEVDLRSQADPIPGSGPNTLFSYEYRDGHNYHVSRDAVFEGRLSPEQLASIRSRLDEGTYFLPVQIGLSPLQRELGPMGEADHVWHSLEEICYTTAPANSGPVMGLVLEFKDIPERDGWDLESEAETVGLHPDDEPESGFPWG